MIQKRRATTLEELLGQRSNYQFHFRGPWRCGKTSLLTALADKVQAGEPGLTKAGKLLEQQRIDIRSHTAPASTTWLGANGSAPEKAVPALLAGQTPAPATAVWPDDVLEGETFQFPHESRRLLGVAFPHDDLSAVHAEELVEYYRDPLRLLVPVIHPLRSWPGLAWPGYACMIQVQHDPATEDPDLRESVQSAFEVAFTRPRCELLASGVDGLADLLADERAASAAVRVTARGGVRMKGRDLPAAVASRYVEILEACAGHVVQKERLYLQPYREALQSMANPLLVLTFRDLVKQLSVVWAQPQHIDDLCRDMLGKRATRTNRNCLFVASLFAKIKRQTKGKPPVYVLASAPDSVVDVLDVICERFQPSTVRQFSETTIRHEVVEYPAVEIVSPAPSLPPVPAVVSAPLVSAAPAIPRPEAVPIFAEDDVLSAGDVAAEVGARSLRGLPLVVAATLFAAFCPGGLGLAWAVFGVAAALLLSVATFWTWNRAASGSSRWMIHGDGAVVLRKGFSQVIGTTVEQLTVRASGLERLLNVGRAFVSGNQIRGWPIHQLRRFLRHCPESVATLGWNLWSDVLAAVSVTGLLILALCTLVTLIR